MQTEKSIQEGSSGNEARAKLPGSAKALTPSMLLAAAAMLSFRATARDRSGSTLGVLVDPAGAQQHLAIAADGSWALANALPAGLKPVLVYESAANVLRGGSLNPDGSISYQGGSYEIESSFDGKGWTAKVRGST
jgi:hypothetical protein